MFYHQIPQRNNLNKNTGIFKLRYHHHQNPSVIRLCMKQTSYVLHTHLSQSCTIDKLKMELHKLNTYAEKWHIKLQQMANFQKRRKNEQH
jgi:hypothetical protein